MAAASTSASSGAIKVSATACAIGTRARPQKNSTAIGTIITPRSRCSLSAVPRGQALRNAKKGIAASAIPISEDTREQYYSGGITLDHEDPRTVYLSRQTGEGIWDVETWTTADGDPGCLR